VRATFVGEDQGAGFAGYARRHVRSAAWVAFSQSRNWFWRANKRMWPRKIAHKSRSAYYAFRSIAWLIFNQSRKGMAVVKGRLFEVALAIAVRRLPSRFDPQVPAEVRQILIFGDMGLGNFLMFTPALEALRKRYPAAEIVALFFKARGAEVVARGNPAIDRLVAIDMPKRAGIRPFLRLLRTCREEGISPDMVVARWNGSPYVALLTAWLKPTTRVGHVSSAGFKGYNDDIFNFPVRMTEEAHEVERNLDLARVLGIEPTTRQMVMPIGDEHRDEADRLIEKRGFDGRRLICLQTGSSKLQAWKRWPAGHWSALADRLWKLGYDLAFVGSDDEADVANAVMRGTALEPVMADHNICGALSVNGTAALVERSIGIICNDSGLMHVAAAVGTPIVGLFGPTEYDRTRPFVDNCVVLRKPCRCNHGTLFDSKTQARIEACDRPCLAKTTPDEVVEAVMRFMPLDQDRTPIRRTN
jgi:heptosyltransferase-3